MTAQPRSATCSSGSDASTGNTVFAGTTERSANEDGTLWWIRVCPCENRVVPSARKPASNTPNRSHTTGRPEVHRRHEPQYGSHEQTTWSPG